MSKKCAHCGQRLSYWSQELVPGANGMEVICTPCHRTYRKNRKEFGSPIAAVETAPKNHETTPSTLDDLVEAQNRTTHAVRSLAITFVAAPIISFLVVIGVLLAVRSGNNALIIIVAILAIVASLGTLVAALDELFQSRVQD